MDEQKVSETENSDHPKVLYVSQADFEWLLHYLEEDEDEELTNC